MWELLKTGCSPSPPLPPPVTVTQSGDEDDNARGDDDDDDESSIHSGNGLFPFTLKNTRVLVNKNGSKLYNLTLVPPPPKQEEENEKEKKASSFDLCRLIFTTLFRPSMKKNNQEFESKLALVKEGEKVAFTPLFTFTNTETHNIIVVYVHDWADSPFGNVAISAQAKLRLVKHPAISHLLQEIKQILKPRSAMLKKATKYAKRGVLGLAALGLTTKTAKKFQESKEENFALLNSNFCYNEDALGNQVSKIAQIVLFDQTQPLRIRLRRFACIVFREMKNKESTMNLLCKYFLPFFNNLSLVEKRYIKYKCAILLFMAYFAEKQSCAVVGGGIVTTTETKNLLSGTLQLLLPDERKKVHENINNDFIWNYLKERIKKDQFETDMQKENTTFAKGLTWSNGEGMSDAEANWLEEWYGLSNVGVLQSVYGKPPKNVPWGEGPRFWPGIMSDSATSLPHARYWPNNHYGSVKLKSDTAGTIWKVVSYVEIQVEESTRQWCVLLMTPVQQEVGNFNKKFAFVFPSCNNKLYESLPKNVESWTYKELVNIKTYIDQTQQEHPHDQQETIHVMLCGHATGAVFSQMVAHKALRWFNESDPKFIERIFVVGASPYLWATSKSIIQDCERIYKERWVFLVLQTTTTMSFGQILHEGEKESKKKIQTYFRPEKAVDGFVCLKPNPLKKTFGFKIVICHLFVEEIFYDDDLEFVLPTYFRVHKIKTKESENPVSELDYGCAHSSLALMKKLYVPQLFYKGCKLKYNFKGFTPNKSLGELLQIQAIFKLDDEKEEEEREEEKKEEQ